MTTNTITVLFKAIATDFLKTTEQVKKSVAETTKQFGTGFVNAGKALNQNLSSMGSNFNSIKSVMTTLKGVAQQSMIKFQGWALSIMFFGMAIKRLFDSILKGAVSVFNKVMQESEGAVSNLALLGGMFEYLQFTIGSAINSALEPFMGTIMSIIEAVSEWVEQNQELVALLVLGGVAIGSMLMFMGMMVLAITGIINGIIAMSGWFLTAKASLATLFGGATMGVILAWAAIIILVVLAIVAAWKENFGGLRDHLQAIFGGIIEIVKSLWNNIKGIVTGVWNFLVAFFKGDSAGMVDAFKSVGLNVLAMIAKIFIGGIMLIANALAMIVQLGLNLIMSLVTLGSASIRFVIEGFMESLLTAAEFSDKIFGTNLAGSIQNGLSKVTGFFNNINSKLIDFKNNMNEAMGPTFKTEDFSNMMSGIDSFLGLNEDVAKLTSGVDSKDELDERENIIENKTNEININNINVTTDGSQTLADTLKRYIGQSVID